MSFPKNNIEKFNVETGGQNPAPAGPKSGGKWQLYLSSLLFPQRNAGPLDKHL